MINIIFNITISPWILKSILIKIKKICKNKKIKKGEKNEL